MDDYLHEVEAQAKAVEHCVRMMQESRHLGDFSAWILRIIQKYTGCIRSVAYNASDANNVNRPWTMRNLFPNVAATVDKEQSTDYFSGYLIFLHHARPNASVRLKNFQLTETS